jgi:hypothetical protein
LGELEIFTYSSFGYVGVKTRDGLCVGLVGWKSGPMTLHWYRRGRDVVLCLLMMSCLYRIWINQGLMLGVCGYFGVL